MTSALDNLDILAIAILINVRQGFFFSERKNTVPGILHIVH